MHPKPTKNSGDLKIFSEFKRLKNTNLNLKD